MQFNEKEYSALLEKIFSITPSVQQVGFASGAYKPGLSGMMEFDARLGCPSKQFPTIHVGGTNGKGSVSSMLASALAATGKRVGLYTSPHLVDFRERMKVVSSQGWYEPSKEQIWKFFEDYNVDGLSFFEMTTGLALHWFAQQKVDCAVIEVGLGGRLDSTNIICPILSVITSIGLDHCALLGDTTTKIAREKAGIFKPGVPALVACGSGETGAGKAAGGFGTGEGAGGAMERGSEVAAVFKEVAASTPCPLYFADSTPRSAGEELILSRMDLQGPCQEINLHTVLFALNLLGVNGVAPEIAHALENTAARTGLRGRWERLGFCAETPGGREKRCCDRSLAAQKASGQREVICDIGHNPAALEINFARLKALGKPLCIVYGIMADKDLDAIAPLMPEGAEYILVAPSIPRALSVEKLYQRLSVLRSDLHLTPKESVASGIRAALSNTSPDTLIYIGGSSFVVTEAIEFFNTP